MKHITGLYPRLHVDTRGSAAVGQAGGVLLVETIRTSGIDSAMSTALRPWRKPLAVHDPGKIVLDLAVALALGGDCLADVNLLRAEPAVFGPVASDPTVSRLVDTLAGDVDHALVAIETARAAARAGLGTLAGEHAPDHATDAGSPLIIDLDATLVTSHSEKEHAAPTFKRGLRVPSVVRVRRPRPGRDRGAVASDAAARQRRVEHRHRPHRHHPEGAGAATRISTGNQAGSEGADQGRLRRRHPRFP